jgi:membrane protein implicated in regulation of membrane protease activity
MEAIMTWSEFYLICFLVGFGLSALSLLAGTAHLHLPHLHLHHGIHLGHGHGGGKGGPSWFNVGTLAAFLAWFGGTGYLLEHYYGVWFAAALAVATLSGLGGASVVFWFLAKVLMSRDEALDPADFDMVGVLGRLSIPIRAGGTGELIYSQEGTRRVTGARAENGAAIGKGAEVVVTRYEKGIAYVRPWEELAGEVESKC